MQPKTTAYSTLLLLLSLQCVLAAEGGSNRPWRDPAYDVRVTLDIVYGLGKVQFPSPAMKLLLLDLYEPTGPTVPGRRRPAILMIHGGAFVGGSRRFFPLVQMVTELASRGYVVASIDYRLRDDFPVLSNRVQALPVNSLFELRVNAAVDDGLTALDWLVDNSGTLNLDPTRLGVIGSSAGASTAIHLAYTVKDFGIDAPAFRFVVDFFGSAIIPFPEKSAADNHLETGEPPLFIVHGTADMTVPIARSEALAARAFEQNVPIEFHPIDGAGHGFGAIDPHNFQVEPGLTVFDRMVEWIHAAVFKPGCLSNSQGTGQGNTCKF